MRHLIQTPADRAALYGFCALNRVGIGKGRRWQVLAVPVAKPPTLQLGFPITVSFVASNSVTTYFTREAPCHLGFLQLRPSPLTVTCTCWSLFDPSGVIVH